MYNNWFSIFGLTVHGYGVMIGIGILAGFFLAERNAKRHGLDANQVDNMVYVGLVFGWIMAKLVFVIVNWKAFLADPLSVLGSSGWVVYGGIIGGIAAVYVYCRIRGFSFPDYFNAMIPAVALGQGFGRIGCFFAGCCYGAETTSHFSLIFPQGSLAPAGVRLIPTQLLSSFGDFVLCLILMRIYENEETRNTTGFWYLILYSAGRFLIEFLRGDIERGSVGPFSTSQFISIFVFAAGLAMLFRLKAKKEKEKMIV